MPAKRLTHEPGPASGTSRPRSRSGCRGRALPGRGQNDRTLTQLPAKKPTSQAAANASGAPWPGHPGLPAFGDCSGFQQWRLLARPPLGLPAAWLWTAAARREAFAGLTSLCRPPPLTSIVAGDAQLAEDAAVPSHEATAAQAAESAEEDASTDGNAEPLTSEDECDSANSEKQSVRREEAKHWPNVLAQMRRFWSEAGAEAARLRDLWERARALEDNNRDADLRAAFNRDFRSCRAPSAAREFVKEELACRAAAAKERARWALRAQQRFDEVARVLLRD